MKKRILFVDDEPLVPQGIERFTLLTAMRAGHLLITGEPQTPPIKTFVETRVSYLSFVGWEGRSLEAAAA
jgi:hypothetical protein